MAAAVNDIQNLLILGIGTYSSHPPLSGQRATQVQALLVLKDLLLSSAFLAYTLHLQRGHQPAKDRILMTTP